MKRTFVTVMPNHIGAFLKASRCFAQNGINITRVSYNKAVDSHMLFIDADGTEEQLNRASDMLSEIGYLQYNDNEKDIILFEFKLRDVCGSLTPVLECINKFGFNISYISSSANGSEYQYFKMGITADDSSKINAFTEEVKALCNVRTIDYNHADKIYDNSVFYTHFVNELSELMDISDLSQGELLVNTNLAMQQLDESGVSPYRTFDSISRFCELLSKARGSGFNARITEHTITDNTIITLIEPPCGSNTAIINSNGSYLFVDTGYACFKDEMTDIFNRLIPNYDSIEKKVFITHADVDHCGLLHEFDTVYASAESAECLRMEADGNNGYREQNPLHKPYIQICKLLTSYHPVNSDKVITVGERPNGHDVLERTGNFDFGELHFELYQGRGGHLRGESVLIDYKNRVVFSGDIFVNLKDMTAQQREYNRYAPILMTSVDTDPHLCAEEREAVFSRLGIGNWQIFGGHGGKLTYSLCRE